MKVCIHCKKEKPEEDFNKSKASKDGLQCYCKECASKYRNLRKQYKEDQLLKLKSKIFKK